MRIKPLIQIVFHLLLGLLSVIVIVQMINRQLALESEQQRVIIQQMAGSALQKITSHLAGLRHQLDLFVSHHAEEIRQLHGNPEDEEHYHKLLTHVAEQFPEIYAFSIVTSAGDVLFDPFKEMIGDVCRSDIEKVRSGDQHNLPYIHPGPGKYHFDVMAESNGIQPGSMVFTSFSARQIAEILKQNEHASFRLYLVHGERSDLIEIGADGDRSQIERGFNLDQSDRSRIRFNKQIEGSRWRLIAIEGERATFMDYLNKEWWPLIALLGLQLGGALLLRPAEREAGGDRLQQPSRTFPPAPSAEIQPTDGEQSQGVEPPGVIDQEIYLSLGRRLGTSRDTLISEFLDQFESTSERLQQLVDEGDWKGVKAFSHQLKGGSGNLGLHSIHLAYAEIQSECESDPPSAKRITALIKQLADHYQSSRNAIELLING